MARFDIHARTHRNSEYQVTGTAPDLMRDVFRLNDLPNELISLVLSFLPALDLVKLSSINQVWNTFITAIIHYRARYYFPITQDYFYLFEINQPHESAEAGALQFLESRSPDTWTSFDFACYGKPRRRYSFTLEPDMFIQLHVIGNALRPQVGTRGPALAFIVPHCDGYVRIKHSSLADTIHGSQTFKVTDHVYLNSILLSKEAEEEGGNTRYEIEFTTLRVRTSELIVTMEKVIDNENSTTTALILRR